jgi:hypothetical protein
MSGRHSIATRSMTDSAARTKITVRPKDRTGSTTPEAIKKAKARAKRKRTGR